jgi:hypothetical protein
MNELWRARPHCAESPAPMPLAATWQARRNYAFALRNRSAACALNWSPETGG